jgi:hypothetical protein
VQTARVVHIISTPYDKANPVAGCKAVETKALHDDSAQGVYVFNPNTGLRAAAEEQGLSAEEQGRQWLRLWTEVLQIVKAKGGKCFVMAKRMGPTRYTLEGGAQSGEVNVAKFALDPSQAGCAGPRRLGVRAHRVRAVLVWQLREMLIEPLCKMHSAAPNHADQDTHHHLVHGLYLDAYTCEAEGPRSLDGQVGWILGSGVGGTTRRRRVTQMEHGHELWSDDTGP